PAGESALRNRIRIDEPAGLAARSSRWDLAHPQTPRRGAIMSLSPTARAIIEGNHHDPFNYLGFHFEGDEPVVRVFLPDASEVKVLDDAGHINDLPRIHDAGLFAGHVDTREAHYRLRAR